jgi:hypothetical protein
MADRVYFVFRRYIYREGYLFNSGSLMMADTKQSRYDLRDAGLVILTFVHLWNGFIWGLFGMVSVCHIDDNF